MSRMAASLAHLGRTAEAQEMAQRILKLNPTFRISTSRKGQYPDKHIAHLQDGMRLAELPD
ncbi:MAG: hypothetical protein H7245_15825 [Candidatus Saccharibacteria bacterium]|nr:hypothetical protein [Pseudorhodobacter sp.]